MKRWLNYYGVRLVLCLCGAAAASSCWVLDYNLAAAFLLLLTVLGGIWQYKLYRSHIQKVLFLLEAIENNDMSIHFSEK